MAHITTGQIAELLAIDSRGAGIRGEVQIFLRSIAAKQRAAGSKAGDSIYYPMDLQQPPHCPKGLTVRDHAKDYVVDPTEVALLLHCSTAQAVGRVSGHDVRAALVKIPVLNANVLDFLMIPENHCYIPENWRGRKVFFWGTTYMVAHGEECVRFIEWGSHGWASSYRRLSDEWGMADLAAVV